MCIDNRWMDLPILIAPFHEIITSFRYDANARCKFKFVRNISYICSHISFGALRKNISIIKLLIIH